MSELFAALLSYPTAIFTVSLGIVLLYWLSVMVGALDIDLFEADVEGAEAALEGAEGAIEGAEGAVDGADAALDGADGLEVEAHGAEGLLSALNLRRAPITVTVSLIVFFGWIASYLGMHYLAAVGGLLPAWLFGTGVLALSLAIALPLTSLATRPLEPVFKSQSGKRRKDYVGTVCVVRTGRVDARFGQAEIVDGGTHLVVPVRIDTSTLARGQKALIVDYDAEREAYLLEAYDAMLEDEPIATAGETRENEARKARAQKTR